MQSEANSPISDNTTEIWMIFLFLEYVNFCHECVFQDHNEVSTL